MALPTSGSSPIFPRPLFPARRFLSFPCAPCSRLFTFRCSPHFAPSTPYPQLSVLYLPPSLFHRGPVLCPWSQRLRITFLRILLSFSLRSGPLNVFGPVAFTACFSPFTHITLTWPRMTHVPYACRPSGVVESSSQYTLSSRLSVQT